MKNKFNIFIILILLLISGCSAVSKKTEVYSKTHTLKGMASWYGKDFHGRLTASGEKYNIRYYTAAHKSLPFGTIVRVTNLNNGKSVRVKINDRGPFVKGRVIDLSPKAFKSIASLNSGVIPVKIEILDDSETFRYKS
ncbi:septal ring lytic transglycosylase RlpA family protein [Ilyobacter polytropus]|uniref:Probable endolytic peptidoglycan transglycosylase RlpA n=1 Tax=Ilyobacter polytropus (strain ATCC 51220 / DSM 2926 / LMG 16218 / CuHBu1) TaxID=572544 RepID=E3HB90_ILYPC|nr:septal ring lytic transglycosylase RlpA family protein [Ilyobacter polytropus]ADO82241.1 rare lipoprotein A [Ilyobacter polytropus DSM 2926]